MHDNILLTLGLAKKSRNIVSGEFSTENAIKRRKAFLVIVATDASDNTKKKFTDKCSFYNVPLFFYSDKESIGRALCLEMRTSVAVTDAGLANTLIKNIKER